MTPDELGKKALAENDAQADELSRFIAAKPEIMRTLRDLRGDLDDLAADPFPDPEQCRIRAIALSKLLDRIEGTER